MHIEIDRKHEVIPRYRLLADLLSLYSVAHIDNPSIISVNTAKDVVILLFQARFPYFLIMPVSLIPQFSIFILADDASIAHDMREHVIMVIHADRGVFPIDIVENMLI